jgi:putative transposase
MGCQRFIYNAKVSESAYFRTFQRKALSLAGEYPPSDQQYSQFKDKELTPFLYEVPSEILRNGAVRYQQALSRYQQKLAGRPTFKKKAGRQSVWLTSELFRFEALPTGGHRLILGKGRKVWGEVPFVAHCPYQLPNSIVISRQGGKWFVSFSYEDGMAEPDEAEILAHYATMSEPELQAKTAGFDRGVTKPFADSAGNTFDFSPEQTRNLDRHEKRRQHYERQMARCTKRSRRHGKKATKIARLHGRAANTRRDFSHQSSYCLANSPIEVFVGEDLRIKNMVKAPAPKMAINAETGEIATAANGAIQYQKNGRRAKSGLAKSILSSCWGQTWTYLQYKAKRKGKLTIKVPPHHSSQECAACGHTHPDNRLDQETFRCMSCDHTDNADYNAAKVLKQRGIAMLLAGEVKAPKRKKTMRMGKKSRQANDAQRAVCEADAVTSKARRHKKQVGQDMAEPAEAIPPTLEMAASAPEPQSIAEETNVSREVGSACFALWSVKREPPTTRPQGV